MPSGIVSRPVIGPNPALFRTKKHSNTTRAHADTLGHSQASERGSDKKNRAYTNVGVSKFESNVSYLDDMSKKRSGNKPGRGSEGKLRDGVWDSSSDRHEYKPNKIGELPTKRQKAPCLPTRLDTDTEESVKDVFAFTESNEPNKRVHKEKWIKPQSKKIPQVRSSMDQRQRIKQTKEHEKRAYIEQGADALKRIREQRGKKVLGVAARRQMQADEEIRAAKQIKKDNYQSSILEYNQKGKTSAKTRREHVNNFNSSVKSAKTKRGAPPLKSSKREKNRAATDSDGASSDDDFDSDDSDRRSSKGYASGAPSSENRDRSRSVSEEENRSDNHPARRRNSLRSADSPTSKSETKSKKNGTTAGSTGTTRDIFNHRQNPSRRGEHARKEPSSKSRSRASGYALDDSDDASDAGRETLELPKDSGRGNVERGMDSPSREKRNASDKEEPDEKYEDTDGVFDPLDSGGGSSNIEQIGELKPHKKRPRKANRFPDFPGSVEVTSEVSFDDTKHDGDKEGVNDENRDGNVREVVVQPKSRKNKVQKFPDLSDSASAMDRDGVAGEKDVDIQVKSRKKKSQRKLPAMPDSPLVASGMASDVEVDRKNVKEDHESSDANEKEEDIQVKSRKRKAQKRLPDMPESESIASKEASDIEEDCGKNVDEHVGSDAEEKEGVIQPKERKRKAQKRLPDMPESAEMPESELIASKEASNIEGDCGKNTDEHIGSDAEEKEDVIQLKERKPKAQKRLPEMPESESIASKEASDIEEDCRKNMDEHVGSDAEEKEGVLQPEDRKRKAQKRLPEMPESESIASKEASDIEEDCRKNMDEHIGSDAEEKEGVLQPEERKRKAQKRLPEMPESELIASKEASEIVGDCGKNTDEHVDSDAEDKEGIIQPKERKRKAQKRLPEMPGSETKLNESAYDVSSQEKTTTTRSTRAVKRSTTETIPETPGSGPISSSKLSGRLSPSGGSVGTRSSGRRRSTTTSMPNKTPDLKSGVLSRTRSRRNVKTSDPEEEKPKDMTSKAGKRTGLKFTGSGAVSVAGTDVAEATNDTPVVDEDPGPRKRLKRVSGKMTTLPESLDAPAENDEDKTLLKIPKKKQRNGNKTAKPKSGELSDIGDIDSDEDKPIWNKSTNSKPQARAQGKDKVLRQTTLFGTKAVETKKPGRKGKATTRAAKATATVTHVSDVDIDTASDADHNGKRPKRKKARAGSAASASQSVKKTSTGTNKGGMDKAGRSKTVESARRSARNIRSSLAKEKSGVEKLLAANPGTGRKGIKTIADLDEKVMVDMDEDDKAADTSTGIMNTSTSAYAKGKKNQLSHSDSEKGHSDDDEGMSDIDDTEFNELYHEHTDTSRINNTHERASDSDGLSDVDEDDDEDEEWQKILEQMKGYRSELKDIKNGKQDSKRHNMFIGAIRERNQLKFMTAQAHLNTKHYGWVTKTLVEWFAPQRLSNSDNYMPLLSYAMDVLLPEVIIRLVRDKNECTYEEAESIMLK